MHKRLILVFLLFLLAFVIIVMRLFYWQVLSRESLLGLSSEQLERSSIINPKRGLIYTDDGTPLVINQPAYLVFGQPHLIEDKSKTADFLGRILESDPASISAKINTDKSRWVAIAEQISVDKVEEIKRENVKGLGYSEDNLRYYPESSMAAHLLGFVGKNHNGSPRGYFGIEGFYDEQLKGKPGFKKEEKDALGNPILAGVREVIPPIDGHNLYLTLDRTVQYTIEKKLYEALEKYGAKSGTVIVMDPKNGEIKGMTSVPSYDPGKRIEFEAESYKNPAVNFSYEPGSTFKILVVASAINENRISPNDTFNEEGPVRIGQYTIKTWNQEYHGQIKIPEILQYSSNVGMVHIGKKLGGENLISYLKKLGLGKVTGIDLQDEATPDTRPENKWYEIDYATASFGQGIAVTPLQMIRMGATIANGGKLVIPHLVKKIEDNKGNVISIPQYETETVFRRETAQIVTEMMTQAVEKGETKFLKPIGIRIAGKTGTAQIPIQGHYDTQKTIASFIGFFPAENPKLIILTTLREPTSSPWGSETAAPLFFSIAKDLISYYNMPLNN